MEEWWKRRKRKRRVEEVVAWWKREVGVCRGGGFGLFLLTAYTVGAKDTCCQIVSDTASAMSGRLSGLCSDGLGDASGRLLGLCPDSPDNVSGRLSGLWFGQPRQYVWSPPGTMSRRPRRCLVASVSVSSPSALPGPSVAIHRCSPDSVGRHRSGSLLGKSSKRLSVAISLALDREVIAEECAENKVLFRGESRNGVLYQNPNRLQTLGFSEK